MFTLDNTTHIGNYFGNAYGICGLIDAQHIADNSPVTMVVAT